MMLFAIFLVTLIRSDSEPESGVCFEIPEPEQMCWVDRGDLVETWEF